MRICIECKVDKTENEFYLTRGKTRKTRCKPCYNKYTNQVKYRKRQDTIRNAKNVPCMDCGKSYPYYVMDFDHVRGTKLLTIGSTNSYSYNRLLNEIKKCDVVCSNCHRERTHNRI